MLFARRSSRFSFSSLASRVAFAHIAEEEYQRAISTGPPVVQTDEPSSPLPAKRRFLLHNSMIKGGTVLGAVGGVTLEALLRRLKS